MPHVRSVLLRESSDIELFELDRLYGESIHVDNSKTYVDGVDGCVCVNLMKRDGSDYDIGSLIYTEGDFF